MRSDPILRVLLRRIKSDGSDWEEEGAVAGAAAGASGAVGGVGGYLSCRFPTEPLWFYFLIDDIVPIYYEALQF